MVCKNSSRIISKDQGPTDEFVESPYIDPLDIPTIDQSHADLEKITYLQRTGEICKDFSNEVYNFFAKITDLCIDKEDNLYVADSKLHKIFKFDNNQKFIISFGQVGQGPGEFTGRLSIRVGNDRHLYVSDDGNSRFSIFSKNGKFIRQFPLPRGTRDYALANSRGEIYLLSESGFHVIDCFSSSFKYKDSFLEMNYHLNFPYKLPTKNIFRRLSSRITTGEVQKFFSEDDHFFVVFINSQAVVQLDQKNKIINKFRISHPRFVNDYINKLKKAIKKGAWVNCFGTIFADNQKRLYFCYYNSDLNIPEIYRYQKNGKFIDTMRVKDTRIRSYKIVKVCDSNLNFYGIETEYPKINIYRIIN
jgi:hypothetical protein